jgi:hypothetical protein
VDIVAYGPRGLSAFEVKRSGRLSGKDTRGLVLFKKDYPMARCCLLYGGSRREYRDGIEVWPVAEALPRLGELLGVPEDRS